MTREITRTKLINFSDSRYEPFELPSNTEKKFITVASFDDLLNLLKSQSERPYIVTNCLDDALLNRIKLTNPKAFILLANPKNSTAMFSSSATVLNTVDGACHNEINPWLLEVIQAVSKNDDDAELPFLSFFETSESHIQTDVIESSEDQYRVLDHLEASLQEQEVRSFQRQMVPDIASELISNAIFDAPTDDHDNLKYYAHREKHATVKLQKGEFVTVSTLIRPDRIFFSVVDNFGRLEKMNIIQILKKCTNNESGRINTKIQEGGHIGYFKIYNGIHDMIVTIIPQKKTEVVCVIDRSYSKKMFRNYTKSIFFHVIDA